MIDQFPSLIEALKAELTAEWEAKFRAGLWFDQGPGPHASILGRNRHVLACQRLIKRDSPDAYYDATTGQWWIRQAAVDREIVRRNRMTAEKLAEPIKPIARTEPEAVEETSSYGNGWLERMRGAR